MTPAMLTLMFILMTLCLSIFLIVGTRSESFRSWCVCEVGGYVRSLACGVWCVCVCGYGAACLGLGDLLCVQPERMCTWVDGWVVEWARAARPWEGYALKSSETMCTWE